MVGTSLAVLNPSNEAIELLGKLGLQYLRLEPDARGCYRYRDWTVPLMAGNG